MRRRARRGGGRQLELEVEALGGRGDGIGHHDGRPVFVPLTLPGDRVRLRVVAEKAGGWRGEVIELLAEGPGRRPAPCPHFGLCGGCALQHLDEADYRAWKRGLLVEALTRQGLPGDLVAPLTSVAERSRRRATLAARLAGSKVELGFHRRASHAVVDLETCLVLTPGLLAALPALRVALAPLLRPGEIADVTISETETGGDLLIVSRGAPDLAAREALVGLAEALDLARVSWSGPDLLTEPVVLRRRPVVSFAEVAVTPPPGGFLQPTLAGEALLTEAVMAGLEGIEGALADLYAGCGTFSFPLARRGPVLAVEGEDAALAALATAAGAAGLSGRVTTACRDLAHQPLLAEELSRFAAVVLDPPRAGARAQVAQLAASKVPRVVAVSCNPVSFARDARILVEGGYRLISVRPIDQFTWSAHLELVAVFAR
jgi:23S rRNA (uracil1939-C5)-methyltransferase